MFEIQRQAVKIVHLNIRFEKRGDEDVRAVDIKFERVGGNKLLDEVVPGLRTALYQPPREGHQADAFNGEMTALAFPQIEMPLKLDGECPGYKASIATGFDADDVLVLTTELKKHKVEAVEGRPRGQGARHRFCRRLFHFEGLGQGSDHRGRNRHDEFRGGVPVAHAAAERDQRD